MYDVTTTLNKFLERISTEGGMSDGDAVKVMKLTRELIEKKNKQSKYTVLNLYCNWCFHTSLSASNTCYRLLDSITDVFLSDDGSKPIDIPHEVSKLLSIKELRSQFIHLYKEETLPTFLFDYLSNWRGFGSQILKEVIHKPIQFPEGKVSNKQAKKIFDELFKKAGHRPMLMARKLWFSDNEKGKEGQVWWFVETKQSVRICGQLIFTEKPEDFLTGQGNGSSLLMA